MPTRASSFTTSLSDAGFHASKFRKIVIMLSFSEKFGLESVLLRIKCKSIKIDIKPVERFTKYIFVLHLVVQQAIIIVCQVYHEAAVLLLEKIAKVA